MSNTSPEKFYITTAIDYVNAAPHIGHALEKVQADVIARYHRLKGDEVFFLTGTDEHGVKIARAATRAGVGPEELVEENAKKFKALREALDLSWDDFIRTSDKKNHWPAAEKLWRRLTAAGDLYKKKYRGLYCAGHEAFVTEKDLVDGICRDHQTAPEVIEEENWFFRLSKHAGEIQKEIESERLRIFPESRRNEILSLIHTGLEDVSFSRPRKDLSWGIPVPDDPEQTMYVWCDALVNYISAVGYSGDEARFKKWWPADLHVIGKDILRFHAAIWPAMLLSAGLPLPKAIFAHGFITVDGEKMSKTVGNVVDPFAVAEKYGTDPLRYYLLREIPSQEDGDFSYRKFEERYNGDLANGIGNLVSRVATLGERLSPIRFDFEKETAPSVRQAAADVFQEYERYIALIRLNEALAAVWKLVTFADRYVNEKKPWAAGSDQELRTAVLNAGYVISTIANLLEPFLPGTARKIKAEIGIEDSVLAVKRGKAIFPRLR